MKMRFLSTAVLFVSAFTLFAQRQITGAFGITIGAQAPQEIKIIRNGNVFGNIFNPGKMKFRNFQNYLLYATPKTHLVYRIMTEQEFDTMESAVAEMNFIRNLFERSYRGEFVQSKNGLYEKVFLLPRNGRCILLGMGHSGLKFNVNLQYVDQALEEQARKELDELDFGNKRVSRPITGAFGIKLGGQVPAKQVIKRLNNISLLIRPSRKFRNFSTYMVLETPKTKKVYSIVCWQDFETMSEATEEMNIVRSIFERSYGTRFQDSDDGLKKVLSLKQKNREISLIVDRKPLKATLTIYYADHALFVHADQEEKQIEMQNTDASMI